MYYYQASDSDCEKPCNLAIKVHIIHVIKCIVTPWLVCSFVILQNHATKFCIMNGHHVVATSLNTGDNTHYLKHI